MFYKVLTKGLAQLLLQAPLACLFDHFFVLLEELALAFLFAVTPLLGAICCDHVKIFEDGKTTTQKS